MSEDIKFVEMITQAAIDAASIAKLRTVPGRGTTYGENGLTAEQLKARFDALPLLAVQKVNEIITRLKDGRLSAELVVDADAKRTLIEVLGDLVTTEDLASAIDDIKGNVPEELSHLDTIAKLAFVVSECVSGKGLSHILEAYAEKEDLLEYARLTEISAIRKRLTNLERAAEDMLYTDADSVRVKVVPEDALPFAAIKEIGGASFVVDGKIVDAKVTSLYSEGVNILATPYPGAARIGSYWNGLEIDYAVDGSIVLNGTATKNTSLILYSESDGLSLPEEGVYIDGDYPIPFYLKSGTSRNDWHRAKEFVPSPSDEYYGRYVVYFDIPSGKTFDYVRLYPSITKGTMARHGVRYLSPCTFEIPAEVLSLPDYGISSAGRRNTLIYTDDGRWVYRRAVKKYIEDGSGEWWRAENDNGTYFMLHIGYKSTAPMCSKFPTGNAGVVPSIYSAGNSIIIFPGEDFSIDAWKAKLREWYEAGDPLVIHYDTPEVTETDVTEYFKVDNLLEVRGGGTITAIAVGNVAVPTVIEYQLEE